MAPRNEPARVVRRPLDQSITVRWNRVRIGAPIPISSLTDIEARVGDLLLRSDTAWATERHLAQARRPRATLVTRSRMTGTGEIGRTGGLYLNADAAPLRGATDNVISMSGHVRLRTRRPRGSATVTRHRGHRALRIQGVGSAGVELPAGAGTKGAPMRFSFQVWIDSSRSGEQVLATVGDAGHHVTLHVQRRQTRAELRVEGSGADPAQVFGTLPFRKWKSMTVDIKEDTMMVEAGEESWSAATQNLAPRFMLGRGFVDRTNELSVSTSAGQFFVDLGSFRGTGRRFLRPPLN